MKIFYAFSFLVFVFVHESIAQNRLPPEYLTKQNFPDSVRNLQMLNQNGEGNNLSNILSLYAGKKIVIDFWASWCRDCISGLPKLENLKTQTDGDKVVYLFISLDKDETKWKSAIDRFGIKGEHYRIETGWKNPLANYVDLDWIPRYLVLNEKGEIILSKAITADNAELKKVLIN